MCVHGAGPWLTQVGSCPSQKLRATRLPPLLPYAIDDHVLFFFLIWLCQIVVEVHGIFDLICGVWDLVPPRVAPRPPALGAWTLSQWTTREVLMTVF